MSNMSAQSGNFTATTNDGDDGAPTYTDDFHVTDGQEQDNPNTDEQDNSDELNSEEPVPEYGQDDQDSDDLDDDSDEGSEEDSEEAEEPAQPEGQFYTQEQLNKMFADRARREREAAIRSDPVRQYVDSRARKLGMTPEQLIKETERMEAEEEVRRIAQTEQVPEHIAVKLQKDAEAERKRMEVVKEQQMYRDFMTQYPEVQPEAISQETWDQVKVYGKSLTEAYSVQRAKELNEQIAKFNKGQKVKESNAQNRKTAPGKVQGKPPAGVIITEKEYRNMTLEQLSDPDTFAKVEASMGNW